MLTHIILYKSCQDLVKNVTLARKFFGRKSLSALDFAEIAIFCTIFADKNVGII